MKITLVIASGAGFIPILFVALPTAIAAVVCFAFSIVSYFRKKEEYWKSMITFGCIGTVLLMIALLALKIGADQAGIVRLF